MRELDPSGPPGQGTLRLDKWLWFARVTKSRTLGSAAVAAGKIKVNRVTETKASHPIKIGDVVTSRVAKNIRVLRVVALGTRRGPATEARALYEDLSPAPPPRAEAPPLGPWAEREPGAGRPTKKDRRKMDAFNDDH